MRNLRSVIEQILLLVPEDEEGFRDSLKSMWWSVNCAAPEIMIVKWQETSEVLGYYIPDKRDEWSDWELKIVQVWNPDYEESR